MNQTTKIKKKTYRDIFDELVGKFVHKLKENWWYVIITIFFLYGITILFKGIAAGVYLTDSSSSWFFITRIIAWSQELESIPLSTDSYTISFFASAEQDYWFFLIIGLAISIPSFRSPKQDGIREKVGHFFPTLDESSPHMDSILSMMNKASCVAKIFHREMIITETDGNLYKSIVNTKFTLKNLHHNHSLDHNIGNFSIKPDDAAKFKYSNWGDLIGFTDAKGNSICEPNKMVGDKFEVNDYNIKLDANEEREYSCCYTIWFDKTENLILSFIRFTESASFRILNQTELDIDIKLIVNRNGDKNTELNQQIKQKEEVVTSKDIKNLCVSADKIVIEVDY